MNIDQIRLSIFLGVLGLMLILESLIPRHATVDSKLRRLAINFSLTGINVLHKSLASKFSQRNATIVTICRVKHYVPFLWVHITLPPTFSFLVQTTIQRLIF